MAVYTQLLFRSEDVASISSELKYKPAPGCLVIAAQSLAILMHIVTLPATKLVQLHRTPYLEVLLP
jgi:hypothetical protein